MRKTHSKDFKFKVTLEAIRGDLTIAQIVSKYQVAESLVHKWKKQLLDSGGEIFEGKKESSTAASVDIDKLHAKIGIRNIALMMQVVIIISHLDVIENIVVVLYFILS
jgi:transposase